MLYGNNKSIFGDDLIYWRLHDYNNTIDHSFTFLCDAKSSKNQYYYRNLISGVRVSAVEAIRNTS